MANLWVARKDEARQALHIAQEAKRLACAIKTIEGGQYLNFAEKWEHESNLIIANFEFFLAHAANLPLCNRFQAEIDVPPIHLNDIKRIMKECFGVDVETLIVPSLPPVPKPVVEQNALF